MELSGWEAAASHYDFFGQATRLVVPDLLGVAGVGDGSRVLDVASGPGHLAAGAARRGAWPIAVERSAAMVRAFVAAQPGLPVVRADGTALPIADRSFDAAVAAFYLNHLDDPSAGVRELCRVTRVGGTVAVAAWRDPGSPHLNSFVADAVARAGGDRVLPAPDHPLPVSRAGLAGLFGDTGLLDVDTRPVSGTLAVRDSTELLDGLARGTVRTAALLAGQPEAVRRRVEGELRRACEPYRRGDRLHVPVAAVVVVGRRG